MKCLIIKLLLVINHVHTKIALTDIQKIEQVVFDVNNNLVINPDGPLNGLRGYLLDKSGYMHNKRFFSSEIDTFYTMNGSVNSESGQFVCDCVRKKVKDHAYIDIDTDKAKKKYLIRYHTQLIRMFPSAGDNLSISAGRPNALIRFLKSKPVEQYSNYILAALLLLTEHVNISIGADLEKKGEEKLFLKRADGIREYFNLSLALNKKKTDQIWKDYHSETVEVIEFFKMCIEYPLLSPKTVNGFTEPTTYEQFMTGNFLNTPQFLIQSYIYEFIKTKDDYIEFVKAVHTLLSDQMEYADTITRKSPKCKKRKLLERAYKKLFIKKEEFINTKNHLSHIIQLKSAMDENNPLPLVEFIQSLSPTILPLYNRDTKEFVDNENTIYSDCVESSILGMLCWLLYSTEMEKYSTVHLFSPSSDLLMFFKNYSIPSKSVTREMRLDWCRVVSGLSTNEEISYIKEKRNEIRSGLLNIFLIIEEVAGHSSEISEPINYLKKMLSEQQLDKKFNVQSALLQIFRYLSNGRVTEVLCEDLRILNRTDNRPDIFGKFQLICEFSTIFTLDISSGHCSVTLMNSSSTRHIHQIKNELSSIQREYTNPSTYIECIIMQYITVELNKINCSINNTVYIPKKQILHHLSNYKNSVSEIFLFGRISHIYTKTFIVMAFLSYFEGREFPLNDSFVRFTKNIIGSTVLNGRTQRQHIMSVLLFNSCSTIYYTNIQYTFNDFINYEYNPYLVTDILKDILEEKAFSVRTSMGSFKCLLKILAPTAQFYTLLRRETTFYYLSSLISRSSDSLNTLFMAITYVNSIITRDMEFTSSDIYIYWLMHSFEAFSDEPEISHMIYDSINPVEIGCKFKCDGNYMITCGKLWNELRDYKEYFYDEYNIVSTEKYVNIMDKLSCLRTKKANRDKYPFTHYYCNRTNSTCIT
ncbi:hypothetical protein NEPAR07_0932 [Nematocida parisii]|uniref:Uncharacterized protein n=1 Tax=Nematocida parisii (strain ERTm3) TaxID=935791 RepID=I3EDP1_NEMP3|nr:hypothetical protein NEQG_02461 [Nematocida parisii ERTm3]KAI5143883.1 hypothetical protein NEPAR07_0932 [Nematocida parisii]